ncbi:hypothetical protein [Helicobacter sp. CLO-3]|uniref:hypothetical protein n=1 Tax=Helicobacter sp. CLO-3 TaxID=211 RepID=UPI0020A3468D|nr:hypothetical protein [Helicobacter sp. CLO-3]
MLEIISDAIDWSGDFFSKAWAWIKKIVTKIIDFAKNILEFFRDPLKLARLKREKNLTAVVIKQNLENGNYNVVECLFNKETTEIEGIHDETNSDALRYRGRRA